MFFEEVNNSLENEIVKAAYKESFLSRLIDLILCKLRKYRKIMTQKP